MIIKLNKQDIAYAIKLGKQRHLAKNINFRNSGPIKVNTGFLLEAIDKQFYPHIIGVLGELAYSKYCGEEMDSNIYSIRDSGEDFNGIEIKTITYFGSGEPELKIPKSEYNIRNKINLYVLSRIDSSKLYDVELLGKITKENFNKFKVSKQYNIKYPENWVVPLSKMEKL